MYDAHFDGDEITMWCEGKNKASTSMSRKRKYEDKVEDDSPLMKREFCAEEQRKIFEDLKKKLDNESSQILSCVCGPR